MAELATNGHMGGTGISGSIHGPSEQLPAPSGPAPIRQSFADLPLTSRSKIAPVENEEADVVNQLGEFQRVPTLSHSECRLIIETVTDNRRQAAGGRKPDETETMSKTRDWLDRFARFKTRDATMAVDRLLGGYGERLDGFERSQIGATLLAPCSARVNVNVNELTMVHCCSHAMSRRWR